MGSQPPSQVTGAAPRPDAVPPRSGAFPEDAVTRYRGSGRQRTKCQRPGVVQSPVSRPCPLPPAGGSRGPGPRELPAGRRLLPEEQQHPRTAALPGRLQAPSPERESCSLRAAPGAPPGLEIPWASRHPPSCPRNGAPRMLRKGQRCRCHGRDWFKIYFLVGVGNEGSISISFRAEPVRDWLTLREDQSLP